jgi:hypothetical protein
VEATGSNEETDCEDCVAGRFVEGIGSDKETDCELCSVGKYVEVRD